ncbi:MAG: glycosyltransferase family 4 protein [Bacteroidales bacterium]|nr:glycosyltransferase family 4 protein [Bacteroidales bacterium]
MKKVLVITYYWPPSGGSGVQRWLKFVKYLREFGWEPMVYTPLDPERMATDSSLESEIPLGVEVLQKKITEPYSLYKFFTGKKKESIKPGFIANSGNSSRAPFKERLSLFVRSNFFIPDPKMLWITPSARYLKKELALNPVDVIVSTGPPHSMHLIARKVSKATGIPWVADFRDPWTKMYNFKYMGYSSLVESIHKKLEKKVLRDASEVVTVTNTIAAEFEQLVNRPVHVITNGFDPADFSDVKVEPEEGFTITYTGLFVKTQNPITFWEILGERCRRDANFSEELKIRLIGHTDSSVLASIQENRLEKNLISMEYTPHNQVVEWQRKARVLLLCGGREPESRGILTGKFFEYMAAARPILGFGPKGGDMDIALEQSGCGTMFDYDQSEGVEAFIDQQYRLFKEGSTAIVEGEIDKYSRVELTRKMAEVFNSVIDKMQ